MESGIKDKFNQLKREIMGSDELQRACISAREIACNKNKKEYTNKDVNLMISIVLNGTSKIPEFNNDPSDTTKIIYLETYIRFTMIPYHPKFNSGDRDAIKKEMLNILPEYDKLTLSTMDLLTEEEMDYMEVARVLKKELYNEKLELKGLLPSGCPQWWD